MAMIAAEALSLRLRGPRRRPLLLHHPALPMHLPRVDPHGGLLASPLKVAPAIARQVKGIGHSC